MKQKKNRKPPSHQDSTVLDPIFASSKALTVLAVILLLCGFVVFCLASVNTTSTRIAGWGVGGSLCLGGIFLLWFARARENEAANEALRRADVAKTVADNRGMSPALRPADMGVRCRIFLQIKKGGYDICYRRVKRTNELVVNGVVYDEITALLEFDHCLLAVLDGHTIEAGLENEQSFIRFDGKPVERVRRLL